MPLALLGHLSETSRCYRLREALFFLLFKQIIRLIYVGFLALYRGDRSTGGRRIQPGVLHQRTPRRSVANR